MPGYNDFSSFNNNNGGYDGNQMRGGMGNFNNNDRFGSMSGGGFGEPHAQFAGGHMSPSQSQGLGSPSKGKIRNNSLRSVTIRQMLNNIPGIEQPLRIDDTEAGSVTFVGRINSISPMSAYTDIVIGDGTGTIEVKKWNDKPAGDLMDGSDFDDVDPAIAEGAYVRVYGGLKVSAKGYFVNVFQIRAITDFNEVTFHMLDVISTHLALTKAPAKAIDAANAAGAIGHSEAHVGNYGFDSYSASNIGPGNPEFSRLHSMILNAMSTTSSPAGTHIQSIIRAMQTYANEATVRNTLMQLVNEGYAYTGADDEHFIASNI
ncbi:uncharacterized protein BJ171DRAFT_505122 [Polychytrium aggregatum]|uniref:uncharacterized protein n=1 Tax=Polychytrium aggregatum TaxID=110093 RepID=UPI0022FDBBFA|nr:uncharacterized protein BJ171DRAFT_505122 [Polychytrium aggregatum]KAI9204699.1 hypothetical protein BJ171DRAFT_505122 [Polychytrium aggregatum]